MNNEETIQAVNALISQRRKVGSSIFLVGIICFAGMILFGILKLGWIAAAFFAVLVVYAFWYAKHNDAYIRQRDEVDMELSRVYLPEIVVPQLQSHFDDIQACPDRGIEALELDNYGLAAIHDTYFSSELMEGSFNGIGFRSAYVRILRHHNAQASKNSTDTTFAGRVYIIDMPFAVTSPVKIINDKLGGNHGVNAYRYQVPRFGREQKFFEEEFSKYFHVYSDSDQDTARVLTPIMQETLAQVRDDLFYIPTQNGQDLRTFRMGLCFLGDKLCVQFENSLDGFRAGPVLLDEARLDRKIAQIDKQAEAVKLIFDAIDSYR